jgi:hypothetical protein
MAFLKTKIFKLFLLFLLPALLGSSHLRAQDMSSFSSSFWDKVSFGGGIGLNFGDGFFAGMLAPSAMYRLSPYVSVGVGLNGQYSSQRDFFKSTVLGGSVFGLFNPIPGLQVSTEFEQLHVSRDFDQQVVSNLDEDYWYPALFLGLGYRSGSVTFGIRYDVLYDSDKSIQPEAWMPFVRFWF